MKTLDKTCRIAVIQAAPVMFDRTACTEKTIRLMKEAAAAGQNWSCFRSGMRFPRRFIIPTSSSPRRTGYGKGSGKPDGV